MGHDKMPNYQVNADYKIKIEGFQPFKSVDIVRLLSEL